MTDVKMTALVTIEASIRTLGELRELVKYCDEYEVNDECELDWGSGVVFIDMTRYGVPADWIECGDHLYPTIKHDVLVSTHSHDEPFAELREKWGKPPQYDWPTKDRLKEDYKNAPNNYEEAREEALEKTNE